MLGMNYKISFKLLKNNKVILEQTIIVKNKTNEYFAKGGLYNFLKKKYDFDEIKYGNVDVIESEGSDPQVEDLKDIFGMK